MQNDEIMQNTESEGEREGRGEQRERLRKREDEGGGYRKADRNTEGNTGRALMCETMGVCAEKRSRRNRKGMCGTKNLPDKTKETRAWKAPC